MCSLINIIIAKFEENCGDISKDILDFVLPLEPLMTSSAY